MADDDNLREWYPLISAAMDEIRREWAERDKTVWGPGPWGDEDDEVRWVDEPTGIECAILRNHLGAWCGYCRLPPGHPWERLERPDVPARVHGGITMKAGIVEPGEAGDGSGVACWIGFDCGGTWDLSPGLEAEFRTIAATFPGFPGLFAGMERTYRDQGYVTNEVRRLAVQIAAWQEKADWGKGR